MTNEAWDAFWIFAGDPIEAGNPAWDSPRKRFGAGATEESAKAIQEKLRMVFKNRTTADWEEFLATQHEMIYQRVQNYDDIRIDPQVIANRYVESVKVKNVGETPVVGNLISFSDTPASIKGGAPELGADTESVLTSLGFTNDDIKSVVEHADNERRMALADRVVDEK